MATFLKQPLLEGGCFKKGNFSKAKNKKIMIHFKIQSNLKTAVEASFPSSSAFTQRVSPIWRGTSESFRSCVSEVDGVCPSISTAESKFNSSLLKSTLLLLLSLLWGIQFCCSEAVTINSPEEILKKVVEREVSTRKSLESWQYNQSVRNWIEKKPGERLDLQENQMKVRPRNESSFMIINPKGLWIHGGTPDDEMARKGRNIQRNLEIASLKTLMEQFDFQGVGKEMKSEIEVYHFRLIPKPDFKPKSRIDKVMREVQGDLWVDLKDYSVLGVEGRLLKPISVAWLFATVESLRFEYQTIVLPIGRVMSGFDLDLKLKAMGGSSNRYRQVRMNEHQSNPGQDIW